MQIPTTLLAAIDSSVGGKTGVDLPSGKNLVGAFHQPLLVLCDTDTLSTLSPEIFADGAAEAIKYGVLDSPALFSQICAGKIQEDREEIIEKCVQIKRDYVAQDERDTGARQFLNLGHTIGHAIEACSNFPSPRSCRGHGHGRHGPGRVPRRAFGAGLFCANCRSLCCFRPKYRLRLRRGGAFTAAGQDKKRGGASITLVLPEQIGKCRLEKPGWKLWKNYPPGGGAIMDIRISPSRLSGTLSAISSKSDAHRALICAALSDTATTLLLNGSSEDIQATIRCLKTWERLLIYRKTG